MKSLGPRVQAAIEHFWATRTKQDKKVGGKDKGARASVTGGKQLDGFVMLVRDLLMESGVPEAAIFHQKRIELPGYFRPEKQWDLVVIRDGELLAAVEFKSHVGPSFGNNYNNRAEEAIGNATDILAAYREGAFRPSAKPWLGYVMLLEEVEKSTSPVSVREPHFSVFPEFRDASYAKRYEITLTRLVRERLYDAAALILTKNSPQTYREPDAELSFQSLVGSLISRAGVAAEAM